MKPKTLINLARVVISLAALAFLVWKIGLGETLDVFRAADLRLLVLAFALFATSLFVRAGRWATLLWALGLRVPFLRLVRLYFVGQFFSSFLPSQFGGDVVRALELTEDTPTPAAVGTVLVDRMTGLMVLMAMGLLTLPFSATRLAPWLVGLLVVVAGGGLLAGGLLLEGRLLRRLTGWLPERLSLSGSGAPGKLYAAITGCGWRALGRAFAISLAFNLINISINYLCGRAVGIDVGLDYFFITAPLISVTGMIPISVGGVGVRDWVMVALFDPVGIDDNAAAAMSWCLYGVSAATGLVGGLLYLWGGARNIVRARDHEPDRSPRR
ncbi:MAG: flippase-like domain-containing protein [Anaerolineae bacterium]|nr:flippase-like domain-containing protein [Anaerolineae bacterium]